MSLPNIKPGDIILMTDGAGGGTITTAAIYSGNFNVVLKTLNVKFLEVCRFLIESRLILKIHSMTDITNGGLRGDVNMICDEANIGLIVDGIEVEKLVNEAVLKMLRNLSIDHLGVSLDSLLIFTAEDHVDEIKDKIRKIGVKIEEIAKMLCRMRFKKSART